METKIGTAKVQISKFGRHIHVQHFWRTSPPASGILGCLYEFKFLSGLKKLGKNYFCPFFYGLDYLLDGQVIYLVGKFPSSLPFNYHLPVHTQTSQLHAGLHETTFYFNNTPVAYLCYWYIPLIKHKTQTYVPVPFWIYLSMSSYKEFMQIASTLA